MTNGPLQLVAVALFAVTGLTAANPMMSFVDCSDSFWAVACAADAEPEEPIEGELVTIDSDPVCEALENGYIVCHT